MMQSTCSTVIFSAPRLCDFEVRYWVQGTYLSKMVALVNHEYLHSTLNDFHDMLWL